MYTVSTDLSVLNDLSLAQLQAETNPIKAETVLIKVKTDLLYDDSGYAGVKITNKGVLNDMSVAQLQAETDPINVAIAALKFASELEFLYTATTNSAFETVLDITGSGMLYECALKSNNVSDTGEIRITIDGETNVVMEVSNDETKSVKRQIGLFSTRYLEIAADDSAQHINLQFQNSLLIEVRRSIGTSSVVVSTIIYGEY